MEKDLLPKLDSETLKQLAEEQLLEMLVEQAKAIEQLKSRVRELEREIEELKVSRDLDSTTSSKPLSGDILKKTEKIHHKKARQQNGNQEDNQDIRKKQEKGLVESSLFEILRPQMCQCCGQREFSNEPIKIETQQVAQLVDRPIEIVEYQRYTCIGSECVERQTADWSPEIVPGQAEVLNDSFIK
jgi:transposase